MSHETIEAIHRAAIRNEEHLITTGNIAQWFENNYTSLIKSEHTYLAEPQRMAALNQVLRYAKRQSGKWDTIKQAEVDVSQVQTDYILEGKIDLVKGIDGTVEIVDFKSENPMTSFPYTKSAIEGTVAAFDDTVHKILRKEFNHCSDNPQTCKNFDFRFYCQNK